MAGAPVTCRRAPSCLTTGCQRCKDTQRCKNTQSCKNTQRHPSAPANMLVFTTSTGVVAVVVARPVSMLAHRCVAGPSAMPDARIHQRLVPSYTAHCTDVSTAARACTGPGHVNGPHRKRAGAARACHQAPLCVRANHMTDVSTAPRACTGPSHANAPLWQAQRAGTARACHQATVCIQATHVYAGSAAVLVIQCTSASHARLLAVLCGARLSRAVHYKRSSGTRRSWATRKLGWPRASPCSAWSPPTGRAGPARARRAGSRRRCCGMGCPRPAAASAPTTPELAVHHGPQSCTRCKACCGDCVHGGQAPAPLQGRGGWSLRQRGRR